MARRPSDPSIRQRIRDLKDKPRAIIKSTVWDALSVDKQKNLGQTELNRVIAIELNDPDQLEFLIGGEPLPLDQIEENDLPLLRERGDSLIKTGKSCIIRGEAYVAEWKRRTERKDHG